MQAMEKNPNQTHPGVRLPKALTDLLDEMAQRATPPVSRSAMAVWLIKEGIKATSNQK